MTVASKPQLRGPGSNIGAVQDPRTGSAPVVAGMHFHDLRHSHKTWLIEDHIPEVAQARRLGHKLPGVKGIYSHVTPAMEHDIIDALQSRWDHLVNDLHRKPRRAA